jgi:hypothetical protein
VPLVAAAYLWLPRGPAEPARVVDFQQYRFGLPPAEFDFDATGPHGPVLSAGQPLWRAYADLFAPSPRLVVIQASTLDQPDHFPIALLRDFDAADQTVFAYLKHLGGGSTQRAGLLWRARNRDNYYAVLADARQDRLDLVKMAGGQSAVIGSAPALIDVEFERRGAPSPTHGWYTLRVAAVGEQMRVWFQGEKKIEVRDGTFVGSGRAGLISQGDTVAVWDDLHVQAGSRFTVPTPRPPAPSPEPPVMHVTEVVTTDAGFRSPARSFVEEAYWRVAVAEADGQPVAGALVQAEVVRPDGVVLATRTTMTGTDGSVFFAQPLRPSDPDGTYTVRVTQVTRPDHPGASYDPAADVASSATFQAMPSRSRSSRRGEPPRSEGDTPPRRAVP